MKSTGLIYEKQLNTWLRTFPKPVGIMTCNDARAREVLLGCRKVGLAVPDEVAIVGVDRDEVLCELSEVPLSSVIVNTTKHRIRGCRPTRPNDGRRKAAERNNPD